VKVDVVGDQITVQADEALLRRRCSISVLNAVQAVDQYGEIQICAASPTVERPLWNSRQRTRRRFRAPSRVVQAYFTTNKKGTGLGLAIVQQIVLAHGWEVECVPNQPKGAIFRITHLKLANHR
jgi:nitrogen fixation/metabolism regulation signal transduction histidine kinase